MSEAKTAVLYRMALTDYTCPDGIRAKELLEEAGFDIDDKILRSRAQVDRFQAQHDVDTTPQISIGGEWIGGCEELEKYLAAR
jgi:glutaredoxin 3